ncbi:MAG: histidinol-phosphate transaminase [Nanoarchaeota archaeon]|nr:histidinol-phosphate transaminase [Nanoarchaeota archaeon]
MKSIKAKRTVQKMRKYDPPTSSRKGKLRMDFNENTSGCSPKVIEALREINMEDLSSYPEYSEIRKKLADYLNVDFSEIVLTNGADEAINVVMQTYLDKGDEIVMPTPTFVMFEVVASIIGAKVKQVLYNDDLSFPAEEVIKNIDENTKAVILVNPNNPTGTAIRNDDLIKIVEKASSNGVNAAVIIDEAYYQFYGKSAKNLIRRYGNIVILQTFSKAFGLAGLRIGCIISNKDCISEISKVLSPYSVNAAAVTAVKAALDDIDYVDRYILEVKQNREWLRKELGNMGIKTFPSDTNFIVADFGSICDLVSEELKQKGILVRKRTEYPKLKNCIRITIGTKKQCLQLVNEIKSIIKKAPTRSLVLPKVLLFDMDGVLADVSRSYRKAIKMTSEYFTGQEIKDKNIQEIKQEGGFNNDWVLTKELIKRKGKEVEFNKVKTKFQELYLGKNYDGLILNEKLVLSKNILKKLTGQYILGIVTGRPRDEAEFFLKNSGIKDLFSTAICKEDVGEKEKPDPLGLVIAMERIGMKEGVGSIRDAYYFGDAIDDMKTAVKAGLIPIGVIPPGIDSNDGKVLKTILINNGAKCVLEDINNIQEVLR